MKKEEKDNPSKNAQIEEFLSARYEFRYNTVLRRAEYRPRGMGDYTAIDRYRINTLKRALDKEADVQTSPENCTASSKAISHHASILYKPISKPYRWRKEMRKPSSPLPTACV